jgi:hypothetical protein
LVAVISGAIGSGVADLAAIASLAEDLVAAALADSAAADSEADGDNLGLEFTSNFSYDQKAQSTH